MVLLAAAWLEVNLLHVKSLKYARGISPELVALWTWAAVTYGWTLCALSFWYIALVVVYVSVRSGDVLAFLSLIVFWYFFPFFLILFKAVFHGSAY